VSAVEVNVDNDWLVVRYDPARVNPQALVEGVRKQGFTAKVVPGETADPPG
jgi:hypothetical protein